MSSAQKIDLGLTGYDELFMSDAGRAENRLPKIYDIPLTEIDDFPDHPFKVMLDEDMDQLVQSVKERGIITPITLRQKEDGRYWSWYGFNSRVEWCACFVSWCANKCGYIDAGVIPKYAGCVWGVEWFKERGQWLDNSAEPSPGMIIFFDWDNPGGSSGPQDRQSDHTGIVEKVEDGRVWTIEGNSGDSCRGKSYPIGYYEILGYGAPAY